MINQHIKKTINIIMGIYNCQDTLQEAVMSLINQSYKDWTLIMCDDGSTDRTYEVASMLRDKYPDQIVLLKNAHNRGLNYTLNKCLKEANCKYIARMDGDDRCSPERLEQEVAVLESEPDISIVSTDMAYFDETGTWGRICHPDYPTKMDFVSGSPFCHAPCLVRKEAFDAVNGYSESPYLLRVEDYHLWFKMYLKGFKGKNIHEVLYEMRDDRNAYSRRKFKYRINEAYVKYLIVKEFHLPLYSYIHVLRPVIVGLLPNHLYDFLHKWNLKMENK